MAALQTFLKQASDFVWGPALLIPLLLATGLYLTIRLRGVQFRRLYGALYLALIVRRDRDSEGDISHFQALMTALAATSQPDTPTSVHWWARSARTEKASRLTP